jgi:phosphoglycerate dehydrogenase-like enzyme
MRVIATREHPEKGTTSGVERVFAAAQINQMLSEADYVVLSAPLTPQTRGIMSAERIAHMKPEACLINVGRGPLVDTAGLVDALKQKKIGAAALDVFDQEPLPPVSPLWDLENLLITPHSAAITEKLWERHYALIRENLRRYLAGEELLGLVDKSRGY